MDNPMTAVVADAVRLDVSMVDNDNKTCLFLRSQDSAENETREDKNAISRDGHNQKW